MDFFDPNSIAQMQLIPALHGSATFVPKDYMLRVINTYGTQTIAIWAFPTGERSLLLEHNEEELGSDDARSQSTTYLEDGEICSSADSFALDKDLYEACSERERSGSPIPLAVNQATSAVVLDQSGSFASQRKPSNARVENHQWTWQPAYLKKYKDQTGPGASSSRGTTSGNKMTAVAHEAELQKKPRRLQLSAWPYPPAPFRVHRSVESAGETNPHREESKNDPAEPAKPESAEQYKLNKKFAEKLLRLITRTPLDAENQNETSTDRSCSATDISSREDGTQTRKNTVTLPVEYLCMPHTLSKLMHIPPRTGDSLFSNFRRPLLTIIEDTSPGEHASLLAACNHAQADEYSTEGKPYQQRTCAENLVDALQQFNRRNGLRGRKVVGSQMDSDQAPIPLIAFANVTLGSKGEIKQSPSKCKEGDYIKFRADCDLVVVMSACPEQQIIFGGRKPMPAHYVIESPHEDEMAASKLRQDLADHVSEKAKERTDVDTAIRPFASSSARCQSVASRNSDGSHHSSADFDPRPSFQSKKRAHHSSSEATSKDESNRDIEIAPSMEGVVQSGPSALDMDGIEMQNHDGLPSELDKGHVYTADDSVLKSSMRNAHSPELQSTISEPRKRPKKLDVRK